MNDIVWSDRMTKTRGKILVSGQLQLSSVLLKTEDEKLEEISRLTLQKENYLNGLNIQWCGKMTKTKAIISGPTSVKVSTVLVKNFDDLKLAIDVLFSECETLVDSQKNKWLKGKKIGSGGFSTVFACQNYKNAIIKIDRVSTVHELEIYEKLGPSMYIPKLLGSGTVLSGKVTTTFLVLEKFNIDVNSLLTTRCITDNICKTIARDVVYALKFMHDAGYVHCDVKPHNILYNHKRAVLADFGLSRLYLKNGSYSVDKLMRRFGTLSYMSCDVHDRINPTPRSDMESFGWVLVKLFGGTLPWNDLEKIAEIVPVKRGYKDIKMVENFLTVARIRRENYNTIIEYFRTVWALEYNERPNYQQLASLFA
jgi:vaccinia related kinase